VTRRFLEHMTPLHWQKGVVAFHDLRAPFGSLVMMAFLKSTRESMSLCCHGTLSHGCRRFHRTVETVTEISQACRRTKHEHVSTLITLADYIIPKHITKALAVFSSGIGAPELKECVINAYCSISFLFGKNCPNFDKLDLKCSSRKVQQSCVISF
jgi:hypothetical protein